jgi:hypothetical protein
MPCDPSSGQGGRLDPAPNTIAPLLRAARRRFQRLRPAHPGDAFTLAEAIALAKAGHAPADRCIRRFLAAAEDPEELSEAERLRLLRTLLRHPRFARALARALDRAVGGEGHS